MEEWKDIKGYNGKYKVSNTGKIISVKKSGNKQLNTDKKVCTHTTYHRVTLSLYGKTKRFQVHRLVAEAFIENSLNKPYINHIDNDGNNNCVDNLEWCTHSENMIHSQKQGRQFANQSKAGKTASKTIKAKARKSHEENIGKIFNKWTMLSVIEQTGKNWRGLFRCECGIEKECNISTVVTGKSKGCHSCMLKEAWKSRKKD